MPLFQNESKCETFHMKMSFACSFILMQIKVIFIIMIDMKKLLDSDWLRAVQFKCNTSAKSVTPVQKV